MLCRLSQNSALVPKKWARRNAVSAVMARYLFKIPVTRLVGTSKLRASSAALMPNSLSSSARSSPGWIALTVIRSLMIVECRGPSTRTRSVRCVLAPDDKTKSKRKRPPRFLLMAVIYVGDDLLSHTLSRAVQSALRGLTSVFGMGTGVSPAVSPSAQSIRRGRHLHFRPHEAKNRI